MSRELRLPSELDAFLARPGPLAMIVRGPPGSGKTTLALAMLEAFYGRKIFVTGRRAKPGVLTDYPWLGTVEGHEIEVVDAVVADDTLAAPSSTDPPAGSEINEATMASVLESLPPPFRRAWGRRGSSARELERDFAWMPAGMRRALSHATSRERTMIVVDSWDAFVDECLDLAPSGPGTRISREEVERTVLRLVGRGSAHLVLILERTEESQLDYLVDGIIRTSHESRDAHPERWITMPKLRGIRIETESYPYTLDGGKFKCLSPEPVQFSHREVFPEPDPEPAPGWLWPGSLAFAEAFGRLRAGDVTVIESDPHVADSGVETLTFPMMASTLRAGGRVLYLPSPAERLVDLWDAFEARFTPEQFHDQVRIVSPGTMLPEGHPLETCLMSVPRTPEGLAGGAAMRSQIPKAREFVTQAPDGPINLTVYSADNLRLIAGLTGTEYTPESLAAVTRSYLIGAPTHLVFLARSGDPLLVGIRMLASIQLLLKNRIGRTFVYGQRPVTPAYSLTSRTPEEERAYGLLRLV